ncbi:GNAT family N-acetyltransferase [Zhouia sp. PK063]|uniref:GNAT family N-acetyltransferase n=1 Tax=Zhouia sp. PK063 TaxID=3373602 RepID=UPI0037B80F1A
MPIEIIPFNTTYAPYFKALNVAWLEKYFVVEPHDEVFLSNCKEYIIDKEGYIFFAKNNDDIVGTFALMKIENGVYELGKMAVAEIYRGYGIGQQLLDFCLQFAERHHWKKILLYSNTKLENAIYLYRKYGFEEVALDDNIYARSDIKMELTL